MVIMNGHPWDKLAAANRMPKRRLQTLQLSLAWRGRLFGAS
jgi:hypothetical protein